MIIENRQNGGLREFAFFAGDETKKPFAIIDPKLIKDASVEKKFDRALAYGQVAVVLHQTWLKAKGKLKRPLDPLKGYPQPTYEGALVREKGEEIVITACLDESGNVVDDEFTTTTETIDAPTGPVGSVDSEEDPPF